jgi:peptidoglycan/LPS O-acetylase OafA/YrhL
MTHFFSIATSVLLGIVFLAIVYGNPFWGLLTVRPMLLLGKGSYSLYLCHGLVLTSFILILEAHGVILASLAPKASWLLLDCGSMLAVFAAVLSYRLVESQFMDTQ